MIIISDFLFPTFLLPCQLMYPYWEIFVICFLFCEKRLRKIHLALPCSHFFVLLIHCAHCKLTSYAAVTRNYHFFTFHYARVKQHELSFYTYTLHGRMFFFYFSFLSRILTALTRFQPLQRHSDISWTITAESS